MEIEQSHYIAFPDSSSSASRNGPLKSTLAVHAAKQRAYDLALQQIDTESALRAEKKRQKKFTVVIAITAMSAFFLALVTIIIETSIATIIAFVFPLLLGPMVIRQRRKLNKLPTLCFVMNQLRHSVNALMLQNQKLDTENQRLGQQVQRLSNAETQLAQVAQKSGSDVQTICDLVRDNAETQKEIKSLQNAMELQSILTVILQSDHDGNGVLGSHEVELLLTRLTTFSVADENKLRTAFGNGGSWSTTHLYNHLIQSGTLTTSSDNNDNAYDITQWLFEEETES